MNREKYKDYPNIFKVAQKIALCKNPDKVLSSMLSLLEGSIKDSANGSENFGLSLSDVLPRPDKPH